MAATSEEAIHALVDSEALNQPTLTVRGTGAEMPTIAKAVRDALINGSVRQTVSADGLAVLLDQHDRHQAPFYQPGPRPVAAAADLVLVVDEAQVAPDIWLVRSVLVAVRELGSLATGEVVPGSGASFHVGNPSSFGRNAPSITARGEGFCKKDLPPERYQYSAIRAAEVNARANLLAQLKSELWSGGGTSFGQLDEDQVTQRLAGNLRNSFTVREDWDADNCRAVVIMGLGRTPSSLAQEGTDAWWRDAFPLR